MRNERLIDYWDTSALIPCFLQEEATPIVREWLVSSGDTPRFTSWLTLFEFETVLRRKFQQKHLSDKEYEAVHFRWMEFQKTLNLIPIDERVSRLGLRVQKIHGLWSCDSVQLGCASLLQLEYPKMRFVCLDRKLSRAAALEGFSCLE